jgi:hypothetical protein
MVDVDTVDEDLECVPRRRSSAGTTVPGRGVTAVRGSSPSRTGRHTGAGEEESTTIEDPSLELEIKGADFDTHIRLFASGTGSPSSSSSSS